MPSSPPLSQNELHKAVARELDGSEIVHRLLDEDVQLQISYECVEAPVVCAPPGHATAIYEAIVRDEYQRVQGVIEMPVTVELESDDEEYDE
jgi:hypothetical protein